MIMKWLLAGAFLLIINLPCFALSGAIFSDTNKVARYQSGFRFNPGVYLTIDDWKNNNPIPKGRFITELELDSPRFFLDLLRKDWLQYRDEYGNINKVERIKIFGYSTDNFIFNKYHVKISIIGSICHYTKIEYKMDDPFLAGSLALAILDASLSGQSGVHKREDYKQYIMNFETGKAYRFKKRYFKKLIITDVKLYQEYKKYKANKRDKMYIFLKKYNEQHPIYFRVINS